MCHQRVDLETWSLVNIQWLSMYCFAVMKQGNRNMLAAHITSGSYTKCVGIGNELSLYTWSKVAWHLWVTCSVISDVRQPSLWLKILWLKKVNSPLLPQCLAKCQSVVCQLFIFCELQIKHKKNSSFRRSAFNIECFTLDFMATLQS
jgi:hypothetical protein